MKRSLLFVCMSVWVVIVAADDKPLHDQVSFQVEVDQEVENDVVSVMLRANAEDSKPDRLADEINTTMRWGLEQARNTSGVKVRTGNYQTYPVYKDRKIQRWRGQQDLLLESPEAGRLSKLLAALQSRLQIQSMQFSVSPEKRRSVQDTLIDRSLKAFQKRARLVTESLGAKRYDILNVSVQTSGSGYMPPVRMESMRKMASTSMEAPAMHAGTSRVTVQVSGSIQLRR